jgi:hypothetical protein
MDRLLNIPGAPKKDENGEPIVDEFSALPSAQQHVMRAWNELKSYNKVWPFELCRLNNWGKKIHDLDRMPHDLFCGLFNT